MGDYDIENLEFTNKLIKASTSLGTLLVNDGSSPGNFAPESVGDDGNVLIADSAQPNGVRWSDSAGVTGSRFIISYNEYNMQDPSGSLPGNSVNILDNSGASLQRGQTSDAGGQSYNGISFTIPETYATGTDVTMEWSWYLDSGGTGTVIFDIINGCFIPGTSNLIPSSYPSNITSATGSVLGGVTSQIYTTTEVFALTRVDGGGAAQIGDFVFIGFRRGTDTFANDVYLSSINIYQ